MDEHPSALDARARRVTAAAPETAALAESKLRRSAYLALRHLACDFDAGVLTLRGHLPTYYLKKIALTAVATVEGVERIEDRVEVVSRDWVSAR